MDAHRADLFLMVFVCLSVGWEEKFCNKEFAREEKELIDRHLNTAGVAKSFYYDQGSRI